MSKQSKTPKMKEKDPYQSPYGWNFVRVRDPTEFQQDTFKWKDVGAEGNLALVVGRPIGRTHTETQALRLEKNHWAPDPTGQTLVPITDRAKAALVDLERQYGKFKIVRKDGDWKLVKE